MNCTMCDNPKKLKKERRTVKYKESGLDNVTLVGLETYTCEKCGEEYFEYGDLDQLHSAIVDILLQKKGRITGKEIRFLRKYLGYSGVMFAKLIGYEKETLSRIENGADVTESFDRLIRFTVANKFPDREYDLHDQLLNKSGLSFKRIELSPKRGGGWKAGLAA